MYKIKPIVLLPVKSKVRPTRKDVDKLVEKTNELVSAHNELIERKPEPVKDWEIAEEAERILSLINACIILRGGRGYQDTKVLGENCIRAVVVNCVQNGIVIAVTPGLKEISERECKKEEEGG